jgi:hypothetical protein
MIMLLQIVVSLAFFVNKFLVLVGRKREGWFVGVLANLAGVFYFYQIGLFVYVGLDAGLLVLMAYGVFQSNRKNPNVEKTMRAVIVTIMIFLAVKSSQGYMTAIELLSALGLVIGTHLLTHDKPRAGWAIYTVAHLLVAYLGYGRGQLVFTTFQIASAIVSIVGATKKQ